MSTQPSRFRRISFGGRHEKDAARVLSLPSLWHRVRPRGRYARAVYKAAPAPAPVYSWTGCYLTPAAATACIMPRPRSSQRAALSLSDPNSGGRGWIGQVRRRLRYQLSVGPLGNWMVGALATTTHRRQGHIQVRFGNTGFGQIKENYSCGRRAADWLSSTPELLTYVNGGYTEAISADQFRRHRFRRAARHDA